MPKPVQINLPDGRVFSDGDVIRITALDPNTGNTVAGVVVNNAVLELEVLSGASSGLASGPFKLIPGPNA